MTITWTIDELAHLLTVAARQRGRRELSAAENVIEALGRIIPPAAPVPPGQPSLALLMGVNIIKEPSFQPGEFRLTRHNDCQVDIGSRTVHHGRCGVIAGMVNV